MEEVLLLSADPWEMADEKTGELRRGVSVFFVSNYRDGDNGLKPTKISADRAIYDMVRGKLPALGKLFVTTRPGAGGKASVLVSKIELTKSLDLFKAAGAVKA